MYAPKQSPTPDEIREVRINAGLTQEAAALLVHRTRPQRWSEWENGAVPMQPDTWELFLYKVNQHPHQISERERPAPPSSLQTDPLLHQT